MVFCNFVREEYFLVGPPPAENSDLAGFRPILSPFQVPEAQAGRNTTESQFSTGGGPTGKKVIPEKLAENPLPG